MIYSFRSDLASLNSRASGNRAKLVGRQVAQWPAVFAHRSARSAQYQYLF
jgi:hypothetical protein